MRTIDSILANVSFVLIFRIFYFFSTIWVTTFGSQLLQAHDHHSSEVHHHKFDFGRPPQTDAEARQRVLDIFHYAIDGEHEHQAPPVPSHPLVRPFVSSYRGVKFVVSRIADLRELDTWKQIGRNANLRRVVDDVVKAYNLETQHELSKKHAQNIVATLPLSHAIEMVSGPVFLIASTQMNLSPATVASVGSTLTASSLPGLDWLCFVVIWSYKNYEGVRMAYFKARRMGEIGLQYYTGFDSIGMAAQWVSNQLFNTQDPVLHLLHKMNRIGEPKGWSVRAEENRDQSIDIEWVNSMGQSLGLSFTVKRAARKRHELQEVFYLESMILPENKDMVNDVLNAIRTQLFGKGSVLYNIKRLLSSYYNSGHLSGWAQQLERQFFIRDVSRAHGVLGEGSYSPLEHKRGWLIEFEPRAIQLSRGSQLKFIQNLKERWGGNVNSQRTSMGEVQSIGQICKELLNSQNSL